MTPQTFRLLPLLTFSLAACAAQRDLTAADVATARAAPVYTADGNVLGVERGSPDQPASYLHLVIQPDGKAPVHVELAPGWYLDRAGLHFSEHDRVHIEGREESRSGGDVVVAHRIRKGDQAVELRDDQGRPSWEQ
ncbi:MAG TPA: hypothetical protein VGI10_11325 [Polyangiaceae bacterium]|jgi:hypothetical protein